MEALVGRVPLRPWRVLGCSFQQSVARVICARPINSPATAESGRCRATLCSLLLRYRGGASPAHRISPGCRAGALICCSVAPAWIRLIILVAATYSCLVLIAILKELKDHLLYA